MSKACSLSLILTIAFFSINLYAEESLLGTLEKITAQDKKNYPELINKYNKTNFRASKVADIKSVKFHPFFLDNLFLNNSSKVLSLATKDDCSLIDLLGTDLLYSSNGPLEHVLFTYQTKENTVEIHALRKKEFLSLIGYKMCPNSQKLNQFFNRLNVAKTLSEEKIIFPQNQMECLEKHKAFLDNVKAPYICNIAKQIGDLKQDQIELRNTSSADFRKFERLTNKVKISKYYKSLFKTGPLDYITNLCSNADNGELFCQGLFKKNYWSNASAGLVSKEPLEYFCKLYLKKDQLNDNLIKRCLSAFVNDSSVCQSIVEENSYQNPIPDCEKISEALSQSRLYRNYTDCPAKIGNDGLVTLSRIMQHFTKSDYKLSSCELETVYPYAKFNQDFLEFLHWNIQFCYEDPIKKEKVCYPSILDDVEDSELSLSFVMGKILNKLKGFNNKNSQCKIIPAKSYNPNLLEYKTGCYILKSEKNCYATDCKLKVFYDELEFTNYTFEKGIMFDFIPQKFTEENKAFKAYIEKYFKKNFKEILNISTYKRYFTNYPDAIFLGLGCAENLLPSFYTTKILNQCTPISFISDGIIEKDGSYSLIVTTAIDLIHAPRILSWTNVFTAVKNFQRFHPLNSWGLYAIY